MRKQSVEFKAELRDPELARLALKASGAVWAETSTHQDTYFRVQDTHVKKRVAEHEPTEYYVYDRKESAHPSVARFNILTESEFAERFGSRELPVWINITKTREIWLTDTARVHLDYVPTLGHFVEIETLVSKSNNIARCHDEISRLRQLLAPAIGGAITTSYAQIIANDLANTQPADDTNTDAA